MHCSYTQHAGDRTSRNTRILARSRGLPRYEHARRGTSPGGGNGDDNDVILWRCSDGVDDNGDSVDAVAATIVASDSGSVLQYSDGTRT